MLALTDGVGLSADDAKTVTLDAARWLLAGAVAELDEAPRGRRGRASVAVCHFEQPLRSGYRLHGAVYSRRHI